MLSKRSLFSNERVFSDKMRDAEKMLWCLSEDNIINPTEHQVISDIVDIYKVDPVFLDVDHKKIESSSINYIEVSIPFKGTLELFLYKPHAQYEAARPLGSLDTGMLLIIIDISDAPTFESVIHDMETQISFIIEWLDKVNVDAHIFNESLEKVTRNRVQDKRRAIRHKNDVISSLDAFLRS